MSKPVIKYPLSCLPEQGLDFERIIRIFNETGILFYDDVNGQSPLVIKGVGNDYAIQLIRNSTKPTQEDIDWAKTKIAMRKALNKGPYVGGAKVGDAYIGGIPNREDFPEVFYPYGRVGSENQEPNKSEKI